MCEMMRKINLSLNGCGIFPKHLLLPVRSVSRVRPLMALGRPSAHLLPRIEASSMVTVSLSLRPMNPSRRGENSIIITFFKYSELMRRMKGRTDEASTIVCGWIKGWGSEAAQVCTYSKFNKHTYLRLLKTILIISHFSAILHIFSHHRYRHLFICRRNIATCKDQIISNT